MTRPPLPLPRTEYARRIAEWEAWDDLSRQAFGSAEPSDFSIRPTRPSSTGSYGVDAAFMSLARVEK